MQDSIDDNPLHDVEAYQVSEERHRWNFFAVITLIFIVGGFIVFLSSYDKQLKPALDLEIILGLNASTLAVILAFAYFFAYRFFDDLFYLFVSLGWFANACYLPFELLFKTGCDNGLPATESCFTFFLYIFAISLLSSISFYMSTLTKPSKEASYSAWALLGLWAAGVAAFIGGAYMLLNKVWPTSNYDLKFAIYTALGALFSSYGLFRVGRHITRALRAPKMRRNRTLNVLAWTFYFYGALQLIYPLKIYFIEANVSEVFISFFIIAFLIKATNVYCLVTVLLTVKYPEFVQAKADVAMLQARLAEQSRLAAVGAIAASIEHDMKTPISSISTKLEAMRQRYPEGKIREYIDKLEVDKNRIASITKVVPFIRGAEDFYDRNKFMGKVSINEVINLAIASIKTEWNLDTNKFFFRINPNSKLAHKNAEHFIRAYIPMLEQVVVNLFKNGIEAIRETGKGGGVITIRIAIVKSVPKEAAAGYNLKNFAKWVKVEIEDNGCGIPADNIPKLTSLFTTKDDRKPNGGIGLYIGRRIIKIHEGCMEISSAEGKGTTVTMYLPEWDAYQSYALGHPEAMGQADDFEDDIAEIHSSAGERQETPAMAD